MRGAGRRHCVRPAAVEKILVRFGQKLFRYWRVGRFFLPEDVNDPPALAIEE